MSSSIRLLFVIFALLFYSLFIFTGPLYAIDGISVEIEPKFTHILLKPSTSYTHEITVKNAGDPTYFTFETRNDPSILVAMSSNRFGPDSRTPLLLEHDEEIVIKIRIRARDETIEKRDYLVEFVASPKDLLHKSSQGINVELKPEVITKLVVGITTDSYTDMQPRITLFRNPRGFISLDTDHQELSLIVHNTGIQGTYLQGVLRIERPSGAKDIVTIPLIFLAAQSQEKIHSAQGLPGSLYAIRSEGLESGIYRARVQLQMPGQHGSLLYASTSFYVLSERILTVGILIAILIFALVAFVVFRHLHIRAWKPVSLETN
ncbi:MAG: hypothetical protein WCJ70_04675 [bacterium]